MWLSNAGTKGSLFVVLTILTVLALGTASDVLANDANDVIYACVDNDSGKTKIVPPDADCGKNWTLMHWNQQGPAGMDGQDGADGKDGVSGYEEVIGFWSARTVEPAALISLQAWCPADKSVVSGGYAFANFDLGALVVEDSLPVTQEGPHKWRVQWRNISASAVVDDFQVWATCADVS